MSKEEDPSTSGEALRDTSFGYPEDKTCICFPVKNSDKHRAISDINSPGDITSVNKAIRADALLQGGQQREWKWKNSGESSESTCHGIRSSNKRGNPVGADQADTFLLIHAVN